METKIALRLGELAHQAGHGLEQHIPLALELLAQTAIQLVELLLAETPALHQRIQRQAALLVHIKVEALPSRHAVHFLEQTGAGRLEAVQQLTALLHIGIGLETSGKFLADNLKGTGHGRLELPALPGGQTQQQRTILVLEIIDVQQIGRRGLPAGARNKEITQHVGAAQIRLPGKVDVISRRLDFQGQLQSPQCPGLGRTQPAPAGSGVAVRPGDALLGPAGAQAFRGQRSDAAAAHE